MHPDIQTICVASIYLTKILGLAENNGIDEAKPYKNGRGLSDFMPYGLRAATGGNQRRRIFLPGLSFDLVVRPLSLQSWRTVIPLREAMRLSVSPRRTV